MANNLQLLVFREVEKFKVRTTSLGIKASFRCTPPITHIVLFNDTNKTINNMIYF